MRCRKGLLVMYLLLTISALFPQSSRKRIPAPLSIRAPLDTAWKSMREVLELKKFEIEREDVSKGSILTRSRKYISGPLAASHIRKIADRSKLVDGDWVKADYQYQVHVQFVSETETLVWVDARIRGLKRAFLGGEEWLPLNSTGRLEEDLLYNFGQHLFGQSFALDRPRPGFWERKPGHVREEVESPRAVGPERPPGK